MKQEEINNLYDTLREWTNYIIRDLVELSTKSKAPQANSTVLLKVNVGSNHWLEVVVETAWRNNITISNLDIISYLTDHPEHTQQVIEAIKDYTNKQGELVGSKDDKKNFENKVIEHVIPVVEALRSDLFKYKLLYGNVEEREELT